MNQGGKPLLFLHSVFLQVFENSPGHEIMDKFGDVLQFSNHVARLFVTEVRRRASDQSTGMFDSDNFYFKRLTGAQIHFSVVFLTRLSKKEKVKVDFVVIPCNKCFFLV